MRCLVIVGLVGCGRLGFDPLAVDDALRDGPGVASCPGMTTVPDEDGDLVGDPCDVCPHLADPAQIDGDTDGVGDACDPAPGDPSQRLRFFDGFNSVLPDWTFSGPSTTAGGQLVLDVVSGEANSLLAVASSHFIVELRGTIGATGAIPQQVFIAVDSPSGRHYVELIDNNGLGRRRSLMHFQGGTFTELDGVTETTPIAVGPCLLRLSIESDRIDGRVETAGAAPAILSTTGTGVVAGTHFVLFAQGLALRLDYAVIIETL